MPLKEVSTPHYVKRTRVFVNSDEKNPSNSRGPFDYSFDVAEPIQNVVSIELTGWNIDGEVYSTFVGRYNSVAPLANPNDQTRSIIPGASTIDVELEDETGTVFLVVNMNVEMGLGEISSTGIVLEDATALLNVLNATFITQLGRVGNATFSNANTVGQFLEDTAGRIYFVAYRVGILVPLRSRFLFRTGPGASDQASRPLGFPPVDTPRVTALTATPGVGSGLNYVVVGSHYYNLQPWRYINVYVDEMSNNFEPVARIFYHRETGLANSNPANRRPFNIDNRSRLLQEPLRRLDRLSIRLTLDDDKRLAEFLDTGHQLTFDVLSLAQEPTVPGWVDQRNTI